MSFPHIAVVIPCYNVAAHIEEVLRDIPADVQTIIAVDDASGDATAQILAASTDARLVILRHERNGGVGAAMMSGYVEALRRGADICVKVDGDGQMDLSRLRDLARPVLNGEADFAKGNRFRDIDALRDMPRVRLVGNSVLSFLTKLVSGYWSILDPTNGYTAIASGTLRRLDTTRVARRYFFETSLLIELNIHDVVVRDVDMPARYGTERSQLSVTGAALTFPILLLRGLARRFFWRYLIKDFNAITVCVLAGLPALLFGVIFGGYHWWRSVTFGEVATAGTVLLAALPVILGFQCVLTAFVLDIVHQPRRSVAIAQILTPMPGQDTVPSRSDNMPGMRDLLASHPPEKQRAGES